MGLQLLNVTQLFRRRNRKYNKVGGGGSAVELPSAGEGEQVQGQRGWGLRMRPKVRSAKKHPSSSSSVPAAAVGAPAIAASYSAAPPPSLSSATSSSSSSSSRNKQAVVDQFLNGPPAAPSHLNDKEREEEAYQQQCRELLRKLSARGNRVPGFI